MIILISHARRCSSAQYNWEYSNIKIFSLTVKHAQVASRAVHYDGAHAVARNITWLYLERAAIQIGRSKSSWNIT
jgi:hypothetical protein